MGASVGGGKKRFGAGFADINVTPFVDVMLVLLIVFMITAPLLATGLNVQLPEVDATETPVKDAKLIVSIKKDETIWLGEVEVTKTLETALIQDKRIQQEKELYIRADKDVRYGVVARVVAASRRAGVTGLNLIVQPTEEGAAPAGDGAPVPATAAPEPKPAPAPAPAPKKK